MRFDFSRRQCEFGKINTRGEKEGQNETRILAIDLPLIFGVTPSELDMLAPSQGVKLSKFLFERKKLQIAVLSPMPIHRRPEGVVLSIYDSELDKRRQMSHRDVRIKNIVAHLEDGGAYVHCLAQFRPNRAVLERLMDIMFTKHEFECHQEQPDLPLEDDGGEDGNDPDGEEEE